MGGVKAGVHSGRRTYRSRLGGRLNGMSQGGICGDGRGLLGRRCRGGTRRPGGVSFAALECLSGLRRDGPY